MTKLKKALISLLIVGAIGLTVAQLNVSIRDLIGTSLPATCTVGQRYFKTDATAGQNLYGCTATNTWTLLGDGNAASSNSYGTYASLPATCSAGDSYRTSDSQYDFACTATNTWTAFYASRRVVVPPATGWSSTNTNSSTLDTTYGAAVFKFNQVNGSGGTLWYRSAPASTYTLIANIETQAWETNYYNHGAALSDSGSTRFITWGRTAGGTLRISKWADTNTISANTDYSYIFGCANPLWYKAVVDSTNLTLYLGCTPFAYHQVFQEAKTTWLSTNGPNRIGVYGNKNNGTATNDWLIVRSWDAQ